MKSLRGHLLAVSPHLGGQEFSRTVVLILQHGPAGAVGVVLNRPLPGSSVRQLWRQLDLHGVGKPERLHFGGPVSGPLVAVHGLQACAEAEVRPGVFVAADRNFLQALLSQPVTDVRWFVGHAGWAQGQLEQELRHGLWMVAPASRDTVFSDTDDLWQSVIRSIGRSVLQPCVGNRFPADVSLN